MRKQEGRHIEQELAAQYDWDDEESTDKAV